MDIEWDDQNEFIDEEDERNYVHPINQQDPLVKRFQCLGRWVGLLVLISLHMANSLSIFTCNYTDCNGLFWYQLVLSCVVNVVVGSSIYSFLRSKYGDGETVKLPSKVVSLTLIIVQAFGMYAIFTSVCADTSALTDYMQGVIGFDVFAFSMLAGVLAYLSFTKGTYVGDVTGCSHGDNMVVRET